MEIGDARDGTCNDAHGILIPGNAGKQSSDDADVGKRSGMLDVRADSKGIASSSSTLSFNVNRLKYAHTYIDIDSRFTQRETLIVKYVNVGVTLRSMKANKDIILEPQ